MFKIQTLNKIATIGLDRLPHDNFEVVSEMINPDAILVRSQDMLAMEFGANLTAIGRAGAGVNNIPLAKCTEKGIVVFNTPGANANAVKELTLLAMLLSGRKTLEGAAFLKGMASAAGEEISKAVEKGKSQFVGPEIKGKKLGVMGLGAIGVMVANAAVALGMEVEGYDPYISVEAAWNLSHNVKRAKGVDRLLATSDYITLHMPQTDDTKGFINAEKLKQMKKGVRILNFSRGGLVVEKDLLAAVQSGMVARYVTDFASPGLLQSEGVICFPHLGASTPEAEDNCAVMVCDQVRDFLENGNIVNSVNFPNCTLEAQGACRVLIVNKNVPNMVGQFTTLLAAAKINIVEMLNKSKGDAAYNIVDIEGDLPAEIEKKLLQIQGVTKVRVLRKQQA
ncbi:MAG: phosphoglycerate dehydrogenase [Fibrobacterota bacterium]